MSLLQGQRNVNTGDPPLHCSVCPKRPDFSDVSHLLTHVASKAHLSSVFKLRVQANADPASKRDIDRYEQWYAEYNLDDLMAERLRQKESKRTSGGAASRRAGESRHIDHVLTLALTVTTKALLLAQPVVLPPPPMASAAPTSCETTSTCSILS